MEEKENEEVKKKQLEIEVLKEELKTKDIQILILREELFNIKLKG